MTISELIAELERIKNREGDIEVCVQSPGFGFAGETYFISLEVLYADLEDDGSEISPVRLMIKE